MAAGVTDILARLTEKRRGLVGFAAPACLAALVAVGATASAAATHLEQEEVDTLLRGLPAARCPTVWVYYKALPAVHMYGRDAPGVSFVGEAAARSGPVSWEDRVQKNLPAYLARMQRELPNYSRLAREQAARTAISDTWLAFGTRLCAYLQDLLPVRAR